MDDCPPGGVEEPVPVDDCPPGGVEDCPPGGVEEPAGGLLFVEEVVEADEGTVLLLRVVVDDVNWPPGGVEEDDSNGVMELLDPVEVAVELP